MSLLQFDCAGLFLFFLSLSLHFPLSLFLARKKRKSKAKEEEKERNTQRIHTSLDLDMHGLVLEASIWLLAGSTGYHLFIHFFRHLMNVLLFPPFILLFVSLPFCYCNQLQPLVYSSFTILFALNFPIVLLLICFVLHAPNKQHHTSLFNCFVFVSQFLLLLCFQKRAVSLCTIIWTVFNIAITNAFLSFWYFPISSALYHFTTLLLCVWSFCSLFAFVLVVVTAAV